MASFQVHQDAEKENPLTTHKGRTQSSALGKQPAVLSVIGGANVTGGVGVGGGGVGGGAFKDKQDRSNLAVFNRNQAPGQQRIVGGSKVTLGRNAKNEATTSTRSVLAPAAAKKSTVVPVVEQFKSFSVYEDFSEIEEENVAPTDKQNNVDKENLPVVVKSDAIHKVFGDISTENDYNDLDATPMSVSEILSPMSVDRSQMPSSSKTRSDDDSSSKTVTDRKALQASPRNDRQRFYEVAEYQQEILEYFRESEQKHRPKPHYMKRQTDINQSMRTILVDWLVEVSEEYNLDTETLYLSVGYIDRFLSHMSVVRSKLQLVGTAAMFVASKYEEIYPPEVSEFVFITDDTYNKAQVLRMEQIILKILGFDLCTPTAYAFINTYVVVGKLPLRLKCLTQYICELSLLDADPYLRFNPSIISAASLALARYLLDHPIWSVELEEITSYRLEDLKEVFLHLNSSHNAAPTLSQQAIQEKYKTDKYKQVSTIRPVEITEQLFDEVVAKYNEIKADGTNSKEQQTLTTTTSNENVRRMISLMFN